MGYLPYSSGFQRITTSGAIGTSGKGVLVTGITVLSGATASVPYIKNGTAVGSAAAWAIPGTASVACHTTYDTPIMCFNGCFVSFDSNTTEVTVMYIQSATA